MRCECALILSGAAGFADDPDRFAELHDPWAESPPLTDPLLLYVHANRKAFRALFEGDPAQARHCQQQAPRGDFGDAFRHRRPLGRVHHCTQLSVGRSGPADREPAEAGARERRGAIWAAAILSSACWPHCWLRPCGSATSPEEAAALLANRLDVLERSGLPDAVMLGYRTVARIAAAEGAEHRALELSRRHACGRAQPQAAATRGRQPGRAGSYARASLPGRDLPRLVRAHRCIPLPSKEVPSGRLWRRSVDWMQQLAHANAAIAAQDWRGALDATGARRNGRRGDGRRPRPHRGHGAARVRARPHAAKNRSRY